MEQATLAQTIGQALLGELEKIKALPQAEGHAIGRIVFRAQVEMIDGAGAVRAANYNVALDGFGTENPRLLFPTS